VVKACHCAQGWTVQLMVKMASLNMPEFQGDAERFDPSRWLENGAPLKKEPKGFMPFGEGPRKCLGMLLAKMEMRVRQNLSTHWDKHLWNFLTP
jgi:cytochrome P450